MNVEDIYPTCKSPFGRKEYGSLRKQYLGKVCVGCNQETQICIFHIGGRGKLGPSAIFSILGRSVKFVFFEADLDNSDPQTKKFSKHVKALTKSGCQIEFKEACIGSTQEPNRTFYINTVGTSNSLLPINPPAGKLHQEHLGYWGKHANAIRTVQFDTVSLDWLKEKGDIPAPHFMVIDVQGAEGEVLEGGKSFLEKDLLGAVLEVEMYPIYKDQPLFSDTFSMLHKKGFLFFGFWKDEMQQWHPYVPIGQGRRIVAEAIYFKDFEYLIKTIDNPRELVIQCMRLARLTFTMGYDSYGFEILNYISQKHPDVTQELASIKYIKDQLDLWSIMNAKLGCWPKLEHLEDTNGEERTKMVTQSGRTG